MSKSVVDDAIETHVNHVWPGRAKRILRWNSGRIVDAIPEFRVIELAPLDEGKAWIYVSLGAWRVGVKSGDRMEFLMLSPHQSIALVENLAMIAALHEDPRYGVRRGHILPIGRGWLSNSACDHFLICRPVVAGEDFETLRADNVGIEFSWVIPITESEAAFGKMHGSHAIEERIGIARPDLLEVNRASIV